MTPRDELRARIARAICDAHDTGAGWDDWAADRQQLYLWMADAALGEVAPVLQALDWYGDESNYDEDGVPGEAVSSSAGDGPERNGRNEKGAIGTAGDEAREALAHTIHRAIVLASAMTIQKAARGVYAAEMELAQHIAASLSSPLPGAGDGVEREVRGHRFEVECRDCEQLDTYGKDDSYVELGREHVRETGHRVFVKATTFMDLVPTAPADDKETTR